MNEKQIKDALTRPVRGQSRRRNAVTPKEIIMDKQQQKRIMQSLKEYETAVKRDREAMIGRLIDAAQTLDGAVTLATKGGDLIKAAAYAADASAFRKAAAEI